MSAVRDLILITGETVKHIPGYERKNNQGFHGMKLQGCEIFRIQACFKTDDRLTGQTTTWDMPILNLVLDLCWKNEPETPIFFYYSIRYYLIGGYKSF